MSSQDASRFVRAAEGPPLGSRLLVALARRNNIIPRGLGQKKQRARGAARWLARCSGPDTLLDLAYMGAGAVLPCRSPLALG
jgi:hypothetical protein